MTNIPLQTFYSPHHTKEFSLVSNEEDAANDAEDEKKYEKDSRKRKIDEYMTKWQREDLSTSSTKMMNIDEFAEFCTLLPKSKLCALAKFE